MNRIRRSLASAFLLPALPRLAFARDSSLPTVASHRRHALLPRLRGLMSYGPDLPSLVTRFAYFTDRILRGAKPAELPVERPDSYELVVNLRAAQALGITPPNRLLLFASDVLR